MRCPNERNSISEAKLRLCAENIDLNMTSRASIIEESREGESDTDTNTNASVYTDTQQEQTVTEVSMKDPL